jgi:hypothetical protein
MIYNVHVEHKQLPNISNYNISILCRLGCLKTSKICKTWNAWINMNRFKSSAGPV